MVIIKTPRTAQIGPRSSNNFSRSLPLLWSESKGLMQAFDQDPGQDAGQGPAKTLAKVLAKAVANATHSNCKPRHPNRNFVEVR